MESLQFNSNVQIAAFDDGKISGSNTSQRSQICKETNSKYHKFGMNLEPERQNAGSNLSTSQSLCKRVSHTLLSSLHFILAEAVFCPPVCLY